MRICIIGGGASGLYCALQIKQNCPTADVTVLEKQPRVGKKLLATGNGKCNFTNLNQSIDFYASDTPEKAYCVLQAHTAKDIIGAFSELGVEAVTNGTLVYPRSLQAASVLDALRFKAEALGIKLICDFTVKSIKKSANGFVISGDGTHTADAVVVASGSSASGGSSVGIKLLRSFGHSASPTYPALVPVVCDTTHTKLAKGMRAHCHVSLHNNTGCIAEENGEILFTDYGVSGICIMQLSRHIAKAKADNEKANFHFKIDFAPEISESDLLVFYKNRRQSLGYIQTSEFLGGYLNKKIGQAILKFCGINNFNAPASNLTDAQLTNLACATKQFKIGIHDVLDASHAQACGGGIALGEFTETLESEKQPGLYACGEVLDVLGSCGGYNLTWAWASGYAVAKGISNK